jgi:hypothetical protein
MSEVCPLYPQERTCAVQIEMSAKCQMRTSVCVASMFALEVKRTSLELVGLSGYGRRKH